MKNWLKGLGNFASNGAVSAVTTILGNWALQASQGQTTSMPSGSVIGTMALGGAVLGAINYWIKSPRQNAN